jgi:hypothetical protein
MELSMPTAREGLFIFAFVLFDALVDTFHGPVI